MNVLLPRSFELLRLNCSKLFMFPETMADDSYPLLRRMLDSPVTSPALNTSVRTTGDGEEMMTFGLETEEESSLDLDLLNQDEHSDKPLYAEDLTGESRSSPMDQVMMDMDKTVQVAGTNQRLKAFELPQSNYSGLLLSLCTFLFGDEDSEADLSQLTNVGLQLWQNLLPDLDMIKRLIQTQYVAKAKMVSEAQIEKLDFACQTDKQTVAEPLPDYEIPKIVKKPEIDPAAIPSLKRLNYCYKANGNVSASKTLKASNIMVAKKTERTFKTACLDLKTKKISPQERETLRELMQVPLLKAVSFRNTRQRLQGKLLEPILTWSTERMKDQIDRKRNHQARRNFVRKFAHKQVSLLLKFFEFCKMNEMAQRLKK